MFFPKIHTSFSICIISVLAFYCSFGQKQFKDTIFLHKEAGHQIYIEPYKTSEKYKIISDFSFAEYQQESYYEQLKAFENEEKIFRRFSMGGFPKQWIAIRIYKQKPYAYYPCDFVSYSALVLTDSTLLDISGEGPQVTPLESFKKISEKQYIINTPECKKIFHLTKMGGKNVAVVENYYLDGDPDFHFPVYELMAPASHITSFPLIVNDCITNKAVEFKFDYPDLKKFIPKK